MSRYLGLLYFLFFGISIFSQENEMDFVSAKILVQPNPQSRTLSGEVTYFFYTRGTADSVQLNAVNMEVEGVWLNKKPISWNYNGLLLQLAAPRGEQLHQLKISYTAKPKQSLYFIGWNLPLDGTEQIWTQGQGKYSSHWVPSFDAMTEKVTFDMSVISPDDYSVVANGKLKHVTKIDSLKRWDFVMKHPMSSYLLAFVLGKFDSLTQRSKSGIPISLYYPKGKVLQANNAYRYNLEIFNFLEDEIGVPYPWQSYAQVPVRDFMYAGMENTGLTTFDDAYLVDSLGYQDRNYLAINAHELAHQWFGNLVTETNGAQHWLHEGFASFYGALAEEEVFGPDHLSWNLHKTANQLADLDRNQKGASLLDPNAGSIIFYDKGAWALFALRDLLGTDIFRKGIRDYLNTYAYQNVTVDNFIEVMESASGVSLSKFRSTWLDLETFPRDIAQALLKKRSKSVRHILQLMDRHASGEIISENQLHTSWESNDNPYSRAALIQAFIAYFPKELGILALQSDDHQIQRAILVGLPNIEPWALSYWQEYLYANSYEIRYEAFFRLWISEPLLRQNTLNTILKNGSLNNLKIRQLWLTLSILTEHYSNSEEKTKYLEDLRQTTATTYNWEIRMHGFQLLAELGVVEGESLGNLIWGTEHHAWQFKLFCRRLLDALIEENPDPAYWTNYIEEFSERSFPYFYIKISEL